MRWLLRLYPQRWRNRYEDEVADLLEQHHATLKTFLDLLLGALDAHLNYEAGDAMRIQINKLRRSTVIIFCAFMIYGVGWSLLQRLPDPSSAYQTAAQNHPSFNILFDINFIVGCAAFLAFLAGGLPITYVAVKRAFEQRKKGVVVPFLVAVSCLVLFVFATGTIAIWHPHTHVYGYLIGYLVSTAILLMVGTVAEALVIKRSEFEMKELKLLNIPKVVILIGMALSVLLSAVLVAAVRFNADGLFHTQDVGWSMAVTAIVLMAVGNGLAWLGAKSGGIQGYR